MMCDTCGQQPPPPPPRFHAFTWFGFFETVVVVLAVLVFIGWRKSRR